MSSSCGDDLVVEHELDLLGEPVLQGDEDLIGRLGFLPPATILRAPLSNPLTLPLSSFSSSVPYSASWCRFSLR